MGLTNRCWVALFIILVLCFVTSLAGAKKKAVKMQEDIFGIIDVKGCEGVELTQCELAMDLITTLKMGKDLTCEAGFVHLRALDIAPGDDWSYEDPHMVITVAEIKDVIMDVHRAYNDGNVFLDGFAVAEEINRLCLDMKGPLPTAPGEAEKEEAPPPSQPQGPQDQDQTTSDKSQEEEAPSGPAPQEKGEQ